VAAKLNFGNVVLCEHVVEGARNKVTLINVYSGDVIVGVMPANLNFGLYMEYRSDRSGPAVISLHILLAQKEIAKVELHADSVDTKHSSTMLIPSFTLSIPTDTTLEVWASRSGYKKTRILEKKISKGTLPLP
jgi:hypothetical protein